MFNNQQSNNNKQNFAITTPAEELINNNVTSATATSSKNPTILCATHAVGSAPNPSLAMRIQRNVISKLSTRRVVRMMGNHRVSALMDALYEMLKLHYDKQTAEKIIKNIIKLIFKLGVMQLEHKLDEQQVQKLLNVDNEVRNLALSVQSFQMIHYSYSHTFVLESLNKIRQPFYLLVKQVLTEKSCRRVDHIFEHLGNKDFLLKVAKAFPGYESSKNSEPCTFTQLVHKFVEEFVAVTEFERNGSNNNNENFYNDNEIPVFNEGREEQPSVSRSNY